MNTDKTKQMVLGSLRNTPIVQVVCKQAGISRTTYYRWFKEDPDFRKAAEEAQKDGVKLINDLAESKLIANINEQNMTAIIFWLKNHHRAYRDKLEVSAKREKDEELTPEEEKHVEEALRLAQMACNPKNHGSKTNSE